MTVINTRCDKKVPEFITCLFCITSLLPGDALQRRTSDYLVARKTYQSLPATLSDKSSLVFWSLLEIVKCVEERFCTKFCVKIMKQNEDINYETKS